MKLWKSEFWKLTDYLSILFSPLQEGGKEMPHEKHPLERNLLTDAILNIILRYGGNRRILMCAFDPYVCTM